MNIKIGYSKKKVNLLKKHFCLPLLAIIFLCALSNSNCKAQDNTKKDTAQYFKMYFGNTLIDFKKVSASLLEYPNPDYSVLKVTAEQFDSSIYKKFSDSESLFNYFTKSLSLQINAKPIEGNIEDTLFFLSITIGSYTGTIPIFSRLSTQFVNVPTTHNFFLKITSVKDDYVEGSLKGVLYMPELFKIYSTDKGLIYDGVQLKITNGSFRIKVVKVKLRRH